MEDGLVGEIGPVAASLATMVRQQETEPVITRYLYSTVLTVSVMIQR